MIDIDLTEEEKEAIRVATPEDWASAIRECVQDPSFWQEIGSSFVEGFIRGLAK